MVIIKNKAHYWNRFQYFFSPDVLECLLSQTKEGSELDSVANVREVLD